jgi:methylmalonyl-CoA mutase N-terminal domain/subunit
LPNRIDEPPPHGAARGIDRYSAWETGVLGPSLARAAEREEQFTTASGIPVERVYGPADWDDEDYWQKLGMPGGFPFTRGLHPTMYRARPWTRRQVVGLGTAVDTNRRHKFVMSQGQTGLSNDFDHPTLVGLDSDDPRSRYEVGRVGVAIDTIHDMEDLFDGIPLDRITTSFTINHPAPVILAMYAQVAKRRGVALADLGGTLQNDPLKEIYAQKTFVFPPAPAVRLLTDVVVFCARQMPNIDAISIGAYQPRDAGTTADKEIAFAFAEGICYIEHGLGAGLGIDDFAPQISFLFNCQIDFFEEIAKFRAARRVWAKLLRDRFGARNPKSCWLRMHVQTAGASLTAQEPENNIVRGTIQALAAAIGGTQSMAVSCYDEGLSIPTEHAQQMSLRTQEIIALESGVGSTVDPIAGSYFVESLTDELETRVWAWIEEIDRRGGMIACVEDGYIEELISDDAYTLERRIQSGERPVVGVNYRAGEGTSREVDVFRVDRSVETEQIRRLTEIKAHRDTTAVDTALQTIRAAATSKSNVMPPIMDAVEVNASLGEIMGALKDVVGEHRPAAIF